MSYILESLANLSPPQTEVLGLEVTPSGRFRWNMNVHTPKLDAILAEYNRGPGCRQARLQALGPSHPTCAEAQAMRARATAR